jgi:hypothetical protein
MHGWRTHRNDEKAATASIDEVWGITVQTAELNTEMSSKLK